MTYFRIRGRTNTNSVYKGTILCLLYQSLYHFCPTLKHKLLKNNINSLQSMDSLKPPPRKTLSEVIADMKRKFGHQRAVVTGEMRIDKSIKSAALVRHGHAANFKQHPQPLRKQKENHFRYQDCYSVMSTSKKRSRCSLSDLLLKQTAHRKREREKETCSGTCVCVAHHRAASFNLLKPLRSVWCTQTPTQPEQSPQLQAAPSRMWTHDSVNYI